MNNHMVLKTMIRLKRQEVRTYFDFLQINSTDKDCWPDLLNIDWTPCQRNSYIVPERESRGAER